MSGHGTSLISLYLPAHSQSFDYNQMIKQEYATAGNIKSKKVRNNVQTGLKSIQEKLKLYRKLPDNGLTIFAGVIESCVILLKKVLQNYYCFAILFLKVYRCDNKFHLDILYEQIQTYDGYGIVLLSGDKSQLYFIAGSNQKLLCTIECHAP